MNLSPPQNRRTNENALPWQSRVIAAEQGSSQSIPARSRVTEILRNEWLAIGAACGPFEWIALGYVAISSVLIAAFAEISRTRSACWSRGRAWWRSSFCYAVAPGF